MALGFDAINAERAQGTLARLLAQPIHRDGVYLAKFFAALLTLAIVIASMMVVVVGVTMFRMGIAPQGEEIVRLVGLGLVASAYLAFWLALAITASVLLRNTVTSALASIGAWFGLGFLVTLLGGVIAQRAVPDAATAAEAARRISIESWINRLSPAGLFSEAAAILLDPFGGRAINLFAVEQSRLEGLLATPVSAAQSIQLVWPHVVVLVAMAAALLAASYVRFIREEIRA